MSANDLLLPFVWVLNGLLVFVYTLFARWQAVLLLPALAWLSWQGPAEHRRWAFGISCLALVTSVVSPQPVPILLLAMGLAGCAAISLEKFNPSSLHWRMIGGIGLYALTGLGISAFQAYVDHLAGESLLLSQGQTYIGILAAVALYGMPLGYLAMLAQGLLVHPPIPGRGSPESLIQSLRARNED
jgi:hypothetical protein